MIIHRGGCHCGRVRFEVTAPAEISVSECNCSICSKSGYLGLLIPAEQFTLINGSECLTAYTFNTATAKHLFCAHCGIKSFYVPRSHPEGFNVNARCLDPGTVTAMNVRPIDGQNWECEFSADRPNDYPD